MSRRRAGYNARRMRPLLFVNWARVNARFVALMWLLVVVLGLVVVIHLLAGGPAALPVGHSLGPAATAMHTR